MGAPAPKFEPFDKITNANTEKGEFEIKIDEAVTVNEKLETENDKFNSENLVTDIKIADVKTSQIKNEKEKTKFSTITTKTTNEEFKTYSNLTKTMNAELKIESREELNIRIESKSKTKNKQIAKTKTKNKTNPPTIQNFSNHIKFIDYIPIHEIITYRHLFAYEFYVK